MEVAELGTVGRRLSGKCKAGVRRVGQRVTNGSTDGAMGANVNVTGLIVVEIKRVFSVVLHIRCHLCKILN